MKLEGMHHITMITGDAREERRVLRRRARPAAGQEDRQLRRARGLPPVLRRRAAARPARSSPGSSSPAPRRGRAGAGMIHTIQLGVASEASLDFWADRLAAKGYDSRARRAVARPSTDYDGLRFELVVADDGNPPLRAEHPEVPGRARDPRRRGRARLHRPRPGRRPRAADRDARLHRGRATASTASTATSATSTGATTRRPRAAPRAPGPCTTSPGTRATTTTWPGSSAPPRRACTSRRSIDRDYFNAIYFRQPQGILFEIATTSPGFAVDEDPEHLGEELRLPTQHEHLRPQLEQLLTPLTQPARRGARRGVAMSALIYRERPAAGDPAGLLVLHHGRGADEHDLLGLADVARPAAPPARRHAARAADRSPAGPAITGTSCRASATPTPTRSTPPTTSSPRSTTSCGSAPASRPATRSSAASRWAR